MRFRHLPTHFQTQIPKHLLFILLVLLLVFPGQNMEVQGKAIIVPRLQDTQSTEEPPVFTETPEPSLTPTPTTVEVEAAVETEAQATLLGSITFQGFPIPPNDLYVVPLTFSLVAVGSPSSPPVQYQVDSDQNGNFAVENIPPGTYHLQVKHANRIPALKWNVILSSGNNTIDFGVLKAGDANNDGFVTATDFSMLSAAYGKCTGQTGFDARSDFNGDQCTTAADFSLLSSNYGQGGTINPQPTATPFPTLTPSPTPTITATPDIPPSARISSISGKNQALPLNCESRSAVDWAGYYGVTINDVTFHNQLPLSDNPDYGFVGNVYGTWGQIPPNAYGVHAEPIAANLRNYGLNAIGVKNLAYADLQRQIARGHPVVVWVIGHVWEGTPVQYTDSLGRSTIVARYEHTVMVIGYDTTSVTILDGSMTYQRSLTSFFNSWGVLGNMAVIRGN